MRLAFSPKISLLKLFHSSSFTSTHAGFTSNDADDDVEEVVDGANGVEVVVDAHDDVEEGVDGADDNFEEHRSV